MSDALYDPDSAARAPSIYASTSGPLVLQPTPPTIALAPTGDESADLAVRVSVRLTHRLRAWMGLSRLRRVLGPRIRSWSPSARLLAQPLIDTAVSVARLSEPRQMASFSTRLNDETIVQLPEAKAWPTGEYEVTIQTNQPDTEALTLWEGTFSLIDEALYSARLLDEWLRPPYQPFRAGSIEEERDTRAIIEAMLYRHRSLLTLGGRRSLSLQHEVSGEFRVLRVDSQLLSTDIDGLLDFAEATVFAQGEILVTTSADPHLRIALKVRPQNRDYFTTPHALDAEWLHTSLEVPGAQVDIQPVGDFGLQILYTLPR